MFERNPLAVKSSS